MLKAELDPYDFPTAREYNVLLRADYATMQTLRDVYAQEPEAVEAYFLRLPGCGRRTLNAIKEAIGLSRERRTTAVVLDKEELEILVRTLQIYSRDGGRLREKMRVALVNLSS